MIDVAACSTYEQGNIKCESCLRYIGFYVASQELWATFNIDENNNCDGYIKK